mmetsp:Transcript_73039/g.128691  ORF Transcript_73039/g.128691 Transcript_73039/m.128691 type:complete len:402 (+) Transcript_73039:164-1369(+)
MAVPTTQCASVMPSFHFKVGPWPREARLHHRLPGAARGHFDVLLLLLLLACLLPLLELLQRHPLQLLSIVHDPLRDLGPPGHVGSEALHLETGPSQGPQVALEDVLLLHRHTALQSLHGPQGRTIHLLGIRTGDPKQVGGRGVLGRPVGEHIGRVPLPINKFVAQALPCKDIDLLICRLTEHIAEQLLVRQLLISHRGCGTVNVLELRSVKFVAWWGWGLGSAGRWCGRGRGLRLRLRLLRQPLALLLAPLQLLKRNAVEVLAIVQQPLRGHGPPPLVRVQLVRLEASPAQGLQLILETGLVALGDRIPQGLARQEHGFIHLLAVGARNADEVGGGRVALTVHWEDVGRVPGAIHEAIAKTLPDKHVDLLITCLARDDAQEPLRFKIRLGQGGCCGLPVLQ